MCHHQIVRNATDCKLLRYNHTITAHACRYGLLVSANISSHLNGIQSVFASEPDGTNSLIILLYSLRDARLAAPLVIHKCCGTRVKAETCVELVRCQPLLTDPMSDIDALPTTGMPKLDHNSLICDG